MQANKEAMIRFLSKKENFDNEEVAELREDLSIYEEDDTAFETEWGDFLCLTDNQADERAEECILDSVWAFNAEFLAAHSYLDTESIRTLQDTGKCEDLNTPLLRTINDEKHFVSDAISADGRGHFISRYDLEEHVVRVGDKTFFIYRMN